MPIDKSIFLKSSSESKFELTYNLDNIFEGYFYDFSIFDYILLAF